MRPPSMYNDEWVGGFFLNPCTYPGSYYEWDDVFSGVSSGCGIRSPTFPRQLLAFKATR